MIEKIILDHLNSQLTEPVYMEHPDPAPASYVLIDKLGSGRVNHLNSSSFAFQSYAATLYKAAQLNEKVKTAVDSLITLNDIGAVRLNTDYNFTDTETKRYRYQAVYDINHY